MAREKQQPIKALYKGKCKSEHTLPIAINVSTLMMCCRHLGVFAFNSNDCNNFYVFFLPLAISFFFPSRSGTQAPRKAHSYESFSGFVFRIYFIPFFILAEDGTERAATAQTKERVDFCVIIWTHLNVVCEDVSPPASHECYVPGYVE